MHVRFANADNTFIKDEVENGFYTNETELVRDAVRRMREDKERTKRLKKAIANGIYAVERGEITALNLELLEKIKEEGITKAKNNQSYSSTNALPEEI